MNGLSTGWISSLGTELELLEILEGVAELDDTEELDGIEELDGTEELDGVDELAGIEELDGVEELAGIEELDGVEELAGTELLEGLEDTGTLEELGAMDDITLLDILDGITSEELEELLLERIELLERLAILLLATLLREELLEVRLLQTAPFTVGRCAGLLATPLFPCTPNSMVWPGLIWLFQPTPVAVKGLLPEILAFQPPVRVVPSV